MTAGTYEDCNNNNVDDDGDGDADCRDRDCAPDSTRPKVCDEFCKEDKLCTEFIKDPARIQYRWHGEPDWLWIHGRFPIKGNPDPATQGMLFQLSNKNGTFYRGFIAPEMFDGRTGGKRFRYRDTAPRIFGSETIADGISRASILLSKRDGVTQLIFRIRLYANLKDATDRFMTSQLVIGDEVGSLTAEWSAERSAWTLVQKEF